MRFLVVVLALCWCSTLAFAQGEAKVSAHLSSGVVRLGDRVSLIVTAENADAAELRALPKVDGLALGPIGAPADQIYESWINGRRSRSVSRRWVVPVRPDDQGEYVIPPLEVLVDGQTVRTQSLQLTVVADLKGEELGFVEIRASSSTVVEGQPFSLELLFGFDQGLANSVDYCNLSLPWWGAMPGVLDMQPPPSRAGVRETQIVLNARERITVEVIDPRKSGSRTFVQLRVVRSFTPTRTGKIEFPTSFFEFGKAAARDFFGTPRGRNETYFVRASEFAIDVVPLPEQGRPLDFSGAIGQIRAKATAEPRDVDAGESIKFAVEWSGSGNLEFFTPPDPARIDLFRSFRVYGKTEQKSFDRRTVTYDLAPVSSEVREIPPLSLSVYDPAQERYVLVSTEPIAVRVRALEGAAGLAASDEAQRFDDDVRDIVSRAEPVRDEAPLGAGFVLGAVGALPIGWLALRAFVRRRGDPDAPAERARRKAARQLKRSLAGDQDARRQLDLVHEFLAARTRASPQAWVGRRMDDALAERPELDRARVQPLFDVVGELERAVWGGQGSAVAPEKIIQAAGDAMRGGL